ILARQWAEHLGKPVRAWMSDKQDAFVTAIADEFVGVPHRYCHNHFLRAMAQPVLALDSPATVKMRSQVPELRALERRELAASRQSAVSERSNPHESPPAADEKLNAPPAAASAAAGAPGARGLVTTGHAAVEDEAGEVVLGYCAAVWGILNNSQGGPLRPP